MENQERDFHEDSEGREALEKQVRDLLKEVDWENADLSTLDDGQLEELVDLLNKVGKGESMNEVAASGKPEDYEK